MQNSVHRTYFTAELESRHAATLFIRFEPEVIVARLMSADDEQDVVLVRDDGHGFKGRTVQALLLLVAAGFEWFRRVRYSYLPFVYSIHPGFGDPEVKTSGQTLH